MSFQSELSYDDRVNLSQAGYHLIDDLEALCHMAGYLNKYTHLSKSARQRIKWFDYYATCHNVSQVCRHFGMARKTFYKWQKIFQPDNLYSLSDKPSIPKRKRQPEITALQEQRILTLRKKYLKYSKIKIAKIYQRIFNETISSWKVQRVIKKYNLYYNPAKTAKITKKRLRAQQKKRITELQKKPKANFLLCLDTVQIRMGKTIRFIFTAIDHYSKVAFARMYGRANSYNAADFLNRLFYLANGKIENIQTDNGSEYNKHFERGCNRLGVIHYFSRVRTPKDNGVNERFNWTIQDEFISLGNFDADTQIFNKNLTEWLIEYNFNRPHQSLNYETPIKLTKVLPTCPSKTNT